MMKKLLGIVVLGLLLNWNAFADHYRILYKDSNTIHIQSPEHFGKPLPWKAHWHLATNHCKSHNKYWFQLSQKMFGDKIYKYYKDELKNMKGYIGEYICSAQKLSKAQSITGEYRLVNSTNYGEFALNNSNNTNNQDINFTISEKKQQCEAIGFSPKTEKFADCVLRLVELDMKNQQSNNMIASQNKSQSDQFMSNALLNLGQQLMQPNSNIYNSNTKNCSVRKSFGNTSTVTCY